MARKSEHDPQRMIVRAFHCDVKFPPDLWRALEAFRAERGSKRTHAVRELLALQLRATGHLAPLRVPQDAAHLEDKHEFPWCKPGSVPTKLAWWSKDPERKTWAGLLDALESETATSIVAICARYGVSTIHAHRIFHRFDLWRRGEDHRPRLNPFSGTPRGAKTGRKGPRKKNHAKPG